jgi:hypothetical protein
MSVVVLSRGFHLSGGRKWRKLCQTLRRRSDLEFFHERTFAAMRKSGLLNVLGEWDPHLDGPAFNATFEGKKKSKSRISARMTEILIH